MFLTRLCNLQFLTAECRQNQNFRNVERKVLGILIILMKEVSAWLTPVKYLRKKCLSSSIPVKSINTDADEKNGKIWQYHLHS